MVIFGILISPLVESTEIKINDGFQKGVTIHWTGLLDWNTGLGYCTKKTKICAMQLEHWTGLLD